MKTLERKWQGNNGPWEPFVGKSFGNYVLVNYHDVPNDDPSNTPPSYKFVLSDGFGCLYNIIAFNISDMENKLLKMEDERK